MRLVALLVCAALTLTFSALTGGLIALCLVHDAEAFKPVGYALAWCLVTPWAVHGLAGLYLQD